MSDRERKQAFVVSALFIAAVVVVLSLTAPREREPRPASADAGAPVAPAAEEPERSVVEPSPPALDLREQRAAVRNARAFLTAYLRFEVGGDGAATRRAIRRTTTSELARVLRDPPRATVGARPKRGRIDGLELGDDASAREVSVVATIDRGGSLTPLTLRLERQEGRWRVSSLG